MTNRIQAARKIAKAEEYEAMTDAEYEARMAEYMSRPGLRAAAASLADELFRKKGR